MKWPNSQMAVLIWAGRQGSVYEPSCPCILCLLLIPSPPNAWVMAYLYTIIRQTHTCTLTVKSHQNKTHKQAHTQLAATLTQLQSLFRGGGLWVGVRDEKWQAELLYLLWGNCVRRPYVHNKFSQAINPTYGRLNSLLTLFTRFECNLLSSAPISNFQSWHLVCLFVFICCPLLSLSFWLCNDIKTF